MILFQDNIQFQVLQNLQVIQYFDLYHLNIYHLENIQNKLQFDIVLDILQTKVEEAEALKDARDTKEHNEKILTLISEKKDGELKGKSIKQLEAMLK